MKQSFKIKNRCYKAIAGSSSFKVFCKLLCVCDIRIISTVLNNCFYFIHTNLIIWI